MNSKGISPMIAIVLLVAFTVAVGGILSLWLTNYATTTTESVQNNTEGQIDCTGTYPRIIKASATAVVVTNPGSANIVNGACYGSGGETLGSLTTPLGPGEISSLTWERGSNTSVICTGQCSDSGVSGECKTTQSCWE